MADVAVEDQDEIAQDFSCMRAHSQGTFSTGVDFGIDTTAPTIGLSRVPQKNDKNHVKYNVVRTLFLFLAARTRKNEKNTPTRARTFSYSGKNITSTYE